MPPIGFEPTVSASERPQTYALDRAAAGNSYKQYMYYTITYITGHHIIYFVCTYVMHIGGYAR